MGRIKTLVIHPKDRSTDFLSPIYQNISDLTVVTENISHYELIRLIKDNDQIIMMGHGSPMGLFNVSRIGKGSYVAGFEVDLLADKKNIFIWCNADKFVQRHKLKALYTGMFISETGEARAMGVRTTPREVNQSNNYFSEVLAEVIDCGDHEFIHSQVKEKYGVLTEDNDVAAYNHQRWYLS